MNEKELFNEVLKHFVDKYWLEIERPIEDRPQYFVIKSGGIEIGGMTTEGYNLLRNLTELCSILKDELR